MVDRLDEKTIVSTNGGGCAGVGVKCWPLFTGRNCVVCNHVLTIVKTCGRCCVPVYCSKQCQNKHWELKHRTTCKRLESAAKIVGSIVDHESGMSSRSPWPTIRCIVANVFTLESTLPFHILNLDAELELTSDSNTFDDAINRFNTLTLVLRKIDSLNTSMAEKRKMKQVYIVYTRIKISVY